MKKTTTHDVYTTNTYEAAYYLLCGAKLHNVEFSLTGGHYMLVLRGVKPYWRKKWYSWFTTVNVRLYAQKRLELKREVGRRKAREVSKGRLQK